MPSTLDTFRAEQTRHTSRCRTGGLIMHDPNTRRVVIVPLTCKRWDCPSCAKRLRRIWSARIAAAHPDRFITLTVDPRRHASPQAAYEAALKALPKFIRLARDRFGPMEYAGIWELHESGYPHLHLAQRGPFLPQRWMSAHWARLGIGKIVHIKRIHDGPGCARYVAKYMAKTMQGRTSHLAIRRIVMRSRGFELKSPAPDTTRAPVKPLVVPTRREIADVVEFLVYDVGCTFAEDSTPRRLVLVLPDVLPHDRSAVEILGAAAGR